MITSKGAGNFKLPLLFVVMLLPLVFNGGGKMSVDHLLLVMTGRDGRVNERTGGLRSTGIGLAVLGLATVWVEPIWGFSLFGLAILAFFIPGFGEKR